MKTCMMITALFGIISYFTITPEIQVKSAQEKRNMTESATNKIAENELLVSIETPSSLNVQKTQPFTLSVKISNVTDREIDVSIPASIQLKAIDTSEEQPQNFWSPLVVKRLLGKNVSSKLPPHKDVTIEVDLTAASWENTKYSVWPAKKLFDVVPKGQYELLIELQLGHRERKDNKYPQVIKKQSNPLIVYVY